MVHAGDEIFAITSAGGVIRTSVAEVKQSGRQTMGVRLMNLAAGDSVVGLALNAESMAEAEVADLDDALDSVDPDSVDPDSADPDPADVEEGEAE
jgi:DNA gyrase subunit A